tara:strand:- start:659 stop:1963 length:1305 start_codon:yes stop_codon:yes gene_type:complete
MYYDIAFILITIIWIILGNSKLKLNPLFVIFLACILLGILLNLSATNISFDIFNGFMSVSKKIGLLIFFGVIIGICLEKSGATEIISIGLIKKLSFLPITYIINLIGFLISIPVFCDAAFIILSSFSKKISELTKNSKKTIAVALSTGLFATHVLVPPTPGPLAAAASLDLKNIFLLFVCGGIFAFFLSLIGGFYSQKFIQETKTISEENLKVLISGMSTKKTMSFNLASSPVWIPLVIMSLNPIVPSKINILTSPAFALFIGAIISIYLSIKNIKFKKLLLISLKQSLPIIGITGMGGGLGQIIKNIDVVSWFSEIDGFTSLGIIIPFLISASLKTAQGSSTVAIVTSASIIYPMLSVFGLDNELGKTLAILSIGVGSMTVSHANDSYFWVVSQFSGMDVSTTYKTHTVATLFQGIFGIIILFIIYKVIVFFN